jgi:hypothetical protein
MREPRMFSLQNKGTKMYLIVPDDNVTLKFTPRLEEASTFREEELEFYEARFRDHGPFNRVPNP